MKSTLVILSLFCAIAVCGQSQNSTPMIDKTTISTFDLNRYLGNWYELARFNHSFEKGLEGVTANYSFRKDGKIKVINQGYKGSLQGKKSTAIGKAKLNPNGKPGQLKVSFFLFFYGDYFILELEPNYQWAIIGSSSDTFLWILSRTPKVSPEVKAHLTDLAKKRGYKVDRLIWVEQE